MEKSDSDVGLPRIPACVSFPAYNIPFYNIASFPSKLQVHTYESCKRLVFRSLRLCFPPPSPPKYREYSFEVHFRATHLPNMFNLGRRDLSFALDLVRRAITKWTSHNKEENWEWRHRPQLKCRPHGTRTGRDGSTRLQCILDISDPQNMFSTTQMVPRTFFAAYLPTSNTVHRMCRFI
jgi:hypothetical protein